MENQANSKTVSDLERKELNECPQTLVPQHTTLVKPTEDTNKEKDSFLFGMFQKGILKPNVGTAPFFGREKERNDFLNYSFKAL